MKKRYFNKDRLILKTKEEIKEIILDLNLTEENILEYYDIPVLFFLTGEKHSFVVYWINSEDDFEQFFMIESTKHQLNAYKENMIDLKTFLSGTKYFIIENNHNKKEQIISNVNKEYYISIISKIESGIKHHKFK